PATLAARPSRLSTIRTGERLICLTTGPSKDHSINPTTSTLVFSRAASRGIAGTFDWKPKIAADISPSNSTASPRTARCTSTALWKNTLRVDEPRQWSLEQPFLYMVQGLIVSEGTLLDDQATTFGFRTIRFDPGQGFFLNDHPLKLKGTCNHQDHAGVGVAV